MARKIATNDKERVQNIISDLRELIESKEKQRDQMLDQLALVDVLIDEMDEVIVDIDKQIPPILDVINAEVDNVRDAYDARINAGCRSALAWVRIDSWKFRQFNGETWQVQQNPDTAYTLGYYGLKFWRKPSNRDYGSNIIASFNGNIVGNGVTLGAISTETSFSKIKVGDIITDKIDSPALWDLGDLPTVIGFGMTDTHSGITTEIQGSTTVASNFLAQTGIGTTVATPAGSGIGLTGIFPSGTVVLSHEEQNFERRQYDPAAGWTTTTNPTWGYVLSNVAIASTEDQFFHVGIMTNTPSLFLSTETTSPTDVFNEQFHAIRAAASPDEDFDIEKNPIDPVNIGIINPYTGSGDEPGVGHKSEINNNKSPVGPHTWREVLQHPEPAAGAGQIVSNEGTTDWPVTFNTSGNGEPGLAPEGMIVSATGIVTTLGTAPNPVPQSIPGSSTCGPLDAAITAAEAQYISVRDEQLPKAQKLAAQVVALRKLRYRKETQAWGCLQGAAFCRQEIQELRDNLNDLESQNLT